MASVEWITRLFHSIDTNDPDIFASFLTPDALFRFANQEPVVGKEAARQTVAEFLSSIKAIHPRQTAPLSEKPSGQLLTSH
jgi:hypothetical protein